MIQGLRTPPRFVLHPWLPSAAPSALIEFSYLIRASFNLSDIICNLDDKLKHVGHFAQRDVTLEAFVVLIHKAACLKSRAYSSQGILVRGSCDFVDHPCISERAETIHEVTRTKHETHYHFI